MAFLTLSPVLLLTLLQHCFTFHHLALLIVKSASVPEVPSSTEPSCRTARALGSSSGGLLRISGCPGSRGVLLVEGLELGSPSLNPVAREASRSPPFYDPGHWQAHWLSWISWEPKQRPSLSWTGACLALRMPVSSATGRVRVGTAGILWPGLGMERRLFALGPSHTGGPQGLAGR